LWAAAEAAANHTVRLLFNAERAARLEQQKALGSTFGGFSNVVNVVLTATATRASGLQEEVRKATRMVILQHLMALAADESAQASVRSIAMTTLGTLKSDSALAANLIERFLRDGKAPAMAKPLDPPPGQPIGCEDPWVALR
jgi:hypothetical protein